MQFDRASSFYDAPWPSDDLLDAGGRPHMRGFPNPQDRTLTRDAIAAIEESAHGFALAGGIFFAVDGPLDASRLPALADTTSSGATVFLLGTDPASPDYLRRTPIEVGVTAEAGPYAPANLLALVPLQGVPLRPRTTYAAVVMRALPDAAGRPLGRSAAMAALAAGQRPAGLGDAAFATYRRALAALAAANVDVAGVAALAAFTTDDPTADLGRFLADALARPLPAPK